ncbi:DNA repair and recombination protein RAD54 [Dichanthelium oligosanthes]|uniref:DNA repair and recombination protein RAD54 n=1 Tax=Dichanthelium oligosanthes TaxID=888268 RepID=A0A1E5W3X9_9POAL|nr:DNA repair and recombination protein RAD54 [Dichanthelium oligosanthes]
MPSRSKHSRLDLDGEEEEIVAISSEPDESESEAERGAEADDDDDEYVGESSDAGGCDEAEGQGSSDSGEGGDGDGHGDGGRPLRGGRRGVMAPDRERKSQNVDALVRGNLVVKRQPLIPRILSVSDAAAIARKPFKPPCQNGYSENNEQLARRLSARKRFVPWGSTQTFAVIHNLPQSPAVASVSSSEKEEPLPPGIEPLVLWQREECDKENCNSASIEVDHLLVRYLRPHQREGVQFMFDCVSGSLSDDGISGCILADDMGLGKTLQSITLLYTLLCQGFDDKPMVKRAVIVTPTSLVSNWESEIIKWLKGRLQLLALCESTRADVLSGIESFLKPLSRLQVLIISYETFRMHSSKFERPGSCDLLICDEAHRLKNDQTLTNKALAALPCTRRILLSGTPMQNDLEEFFSMVNFTNPGVLGDASYFRRYYEVSMELDMNQAFILRRTNALLSNHLPPKIVEVVCCKLTPLQTTLYNHFIHSKNVKRLISEEAKQSKILAYITALKKLCNHPKLIYDTIKSNNSGGSGFDDCLRFFPPELFSGRSGSWTGGGGMWVELSGKMHVLARLLGHLRQKTDDRIVLVSNYTQVRLDGATSISKRQKLVNQFNDLSRDEFVFLLSSKAGGCGLNLVGGNRLVLFDPDWNPANDKQVNIYASLIHHLLKVPLLCALSDLCDILPSGKAAARVYQRQMSKEGLQKVIQQEQTDNKMQGSSLSTEDLRDLFTFHEQVRLNLFSEYTAYHFFFDQLVTVAYLHLVHRSEIHENLKCSRCNKDGSSLLDGNGFDLAATEYKSSGVQDYIDIGGFGEISGCLQKMNSSRHQIGKPSEEDLGSWGHHCDPSTVPDTVLQSSAGDEVDGKLVPVESMARSAPHQSSGMAANGDKGVGMACHHANSPSKPGKQSLLGKNLKMMGFNLKNSSLKCPTRSRTASTNCLQGLKKTSPSLDHQPQTKKLHVASDMSDDDFV